MRPIEGTAGKPGLISVAFANLDMRSLRARVEAAALAFARASNPDDEIFVVNFADTVHLDVPMTSDVRVLEAGIGRVDSIGGTALRDAVDLAERYLRDHAGRWRPGG